MPYTRILPEVRDALPLTAEWTNVSDADESYWYLLAELWEARETVILVEHDVVPAAGTLDAMAACPHDWCACEYRCGDLYMTALGCTKFSGDLMERNPDVVNRILSRAWNGLDGQIVATLHMHGETEHVHGPAAWHLKWEGETARGGTTMMDRRSMRAMRLLYVGNGRYLNGVPASDFDTDDPETVAQCLGSGLYIEAEAVRPLGKKAAPDPEPVEPDAAPAAETDAEQA